MRVLVETAWASANRITSLVKLSTSGVPIPIGLRWYRRLRGGDSAGSRSHESYTMTSFSCRNRVFPDKVSCWSSLTNAAFSRLWTRGCDFINRVQSKQAAEPRPRPIGKCKMCFAFVRFNGYFFALGSRECCSLKVTFSQALAFLVQG